jgi:hypothetical protein
MFNACVTRTSVRIYTPKAKIKIHKTRSGGSACSLPAPAQRHSVLTSFELFLSFIPSIYILLIWRLAARVGAGLLINWVSSTAMLFCKILRPSKQRLRSAVAHMKLLNHAFALTNVFRAEIKLKTTKNAF